MTKGREIKSIIKINTLETALDISSGPHRDGCKVITQSMRHTSSSLNLVVAWYDSLVILYVCRIQARRVGNIRLLLSTCKAPVISLCILSLSPCHYPEWEMYGSVG